MIPTIKEIVIIIIYRVINKQMVAELDKGFPIK
jgi:hypothetical protein